MNKPSFRSPEKIIGDIKKLNDYGIKFAGLYQDPRMGGEKYWKELVAALRREKNRLERLSLDLLTPADEEFVREVATIGNRTVLQICPDTGADFVRKAQGRNYSNEELLDSIKLCHRYHVPVTVFLSVGLEGETSETIKQTWELWEKLCSLDKRSLERGIFGRDVNLRVPLGGPIIGPIVLEPGALCWDFPDKYGYKLTFNSLEEYIEGLSQPSWHQWLNHETKQLNKEEFLALIFESIEYSIRQRLKYGVYDKLKAGREMFKARADMIAIGAVNRILIDCEDIGEREMRLKSLAKAVATIFSASPDEQDPYGYRRILEG